MKGGKASNQKASGNARKTAPAQQKKNKAMPLSQSETAALVPELRRSKRGPNAKATQATQAGDVTGTLLGANIPATANQEEPSAGQNVAGTPVAQGAEANVGCASSTIPRPDNQERPSLSPNEVIQAPNVGSNENNANGPPTQEDDGEHGSPDLNTNGTPNNGDTPAPGQITTTKTVPRDTGLPMHDKSATTTSIKPMVMLQSVPSKTSTPNPTAEDSAHVPFVPYPQRVIPVKVPSHPPENGGAKSTAPLVTYTDDSEGDDSSRDDEWKGDHSEDEEDDRNTPPIGRRKGQSSVPKATKEVKKRNVSALAVKEHQPMKKGKGSGRKKGGKKDVPHDLTNDASSLVPYAEKDKQTQPDSHAANDTSSLVPYIEFGEDAFNDEDLVEMALLEPDSSTLGLATTARSGLPAQLGDLGAGSPWEQRPQYWQVRSGRPSDDAIKQITNLTSEFTAKLQAIACRDGISQSVAWTHTGLSKREGRKPNPWNYWLAKEMETIRADNGGELPEGGTKAMMQELSDRWKAIPKEEHENILAEAIRERDSKMRAAVKAEFSTQLPRKKRIDEHTKAVTDMCWGEMNQSGMLTAGIVVLPQDGENPAISNIFSSSTIGMEMWDTHGPVLDQLKNFLISKTAGVDPAEDDGWMPYQGPEFILNLKDREIKRSELVKWMKRMEVMTAPWQAAARNSKPRNYKGSYPWQNSIQKCKETDAVLIGWPLTEIWPGLPGTKLKSIAPDERKDVLRKLNRDRGPFQTDRLALEYTPIDNLWIKTSPSGVQTIHTYAVEGAEPVSELPLDEQPVVVTDEGKILVRRGDDETEDPKAHRERVLKVKGTFGTEEEDEDANTTTERSESPSSESDGPTDQAKKSGKGKGKASKKRVRSSDDVDGEDLAMRKKVARNRK